MEFPEDTQVITCPHCLGRCGFSRVWSGDRRFSISWVADAKNSEALRAPVNEYVDVSYCVSCGGPVIRRRRMLEQAGNLTAAEVDRRNSLKIDRVVYPIAPTRCPAPREVIEADRDLAVDYAEAVECEPHSKQAALMLLGRCASQILVKQCGASPSDTLGKQYKIAQLSGRLSTEVSDEFDALLNTRNQAAHARFAEHGGQLRVDQQDVDWSVGLLELMFECYYVRPTRIAAQRSKLARTRELKA